MDGAPDSARAALARADSIRALGPAGWTDGELFAYAGLVSEVLGQDSALIERRSRSRAVRAFGRTVAAEHRRMTRLADSLAALGPAASIPTVSSPTLEAHEREMRRLREGPGFDLAYVTRTKATLTEVQFQLRRASAADRGPGAVRLLNQAQAAVTSQIRTASALERALERASTAAGSGSKTP